MSDKNGAPTPKIKVTGLWKKTLPSGDSMFTGSLSPTAKIVIFKNKFKKKDSDPDYVMYLEPAAKEAPRQADSEFYSDEIEEEIPF